MQNENIQKIRLFFVERNPYLRAGCSNLLARYPQLSIVAESGEIDCFLQLAEKSQPDVILLDVSRVEQNTLTNLLTSVIGKLPSCKILAFAENAEEATEKFFLQQGVSGVFGKNQSVTLLVKAIEAVNAGELWFGRQITKLLLQHHRLAYLAAKSQSASGNAAQQILSDRACNVACLAAKGNQAKKIGELLYISEKTVRNQLTTVYQKLRVGGQVELCMKAEPLNFCRQLEFPMDRDRCPIAIKKIPCK